MNINPKENKNMYNQKSCDKTEEECEFYEECKKQNLEFDNDKEEN